MIFVVIRRDLGHGATIVCEDALYTAAFCNRNEIAALLAYVAADALRLSRILVNLLDNAIRHTDFGRISLSVQAVGESIVFRVRDTGRGMSPDRIERLFELPERVASEDILREHGCFGLPMVKILVERLGGHVEARSDGPGKGSEFVVTLPAAKSTHP
jgi:signal transduction histidine kinase